MPVFHLRQRLQSEDYSALLLAVQLFCLAIWNRACASPASDRTSMSPVQVLLSEVAPWKLALMEGVDAWIQIACPPPVH